VVSRHIDRITILGLFVVVIVGYFSMLTALPLRGEETRWARVAVEMLERGDWVVPRQQGVPFLDRPPLGAWVMAGAGLLRGEVDVVAIRLPSMVAILVTTLLIFRYSRRELSRLGAGTAAVSYACFGQVLQIGWTGENEAVYTLLLSAALLVWYSMYTSGRSVFATWAMGAGLAGLALLVKGPQALVYFVMATSAYVVWRREWRGLMAASVVFGVGVGCLAPALWCAALGQRLGGDAVAQVLVHVSLTRYGSGLSLAHLASYPVMVWGSLLPGSLVWLSLLTSARRVFCPVPEVVRFSIVALLVTFPTLWLAEHAQPRYFMPLFPCAAVLVGWTVQQLASAPASSPARRWWNVMLLGDACGIAGASLVLLSAWLSGRDFGLGVAGIGAEVLGYAAGCLGVSAILVWSSRGHGRRRAAAAITAIAVFQLILFRGVVTDGLVRGANDMAPAVAAVRRGLPEGARLVSLGPVHHRFAYHYQALIPRVSLGALHEGARGDVEYFCFESVRGVVPTELGRREWVEVARVVNDSDVSEVPESVTVVGRLSRR
jgi:4-amino-4-deoxy-L-arabinose transferase-like glycosyltransferase